MAIGHAIPILANETLPSPAAAPFTSGLVYTSSAYTVDTFALWVLLVRVAGTVTGTTPTLVFAVQQSNDQITWATVGAALANITAVGVQVTPYATGTTQGAITQNFIRVIATVGGTSPVFPGVYADLVGQIV